LLFHPANFLEVDENEDTALEQAEMDQVLMAESEESAEKVKQFIFDLELNFWKYFCLKKEINPLVV
jgi:succinyl-CoA synthetase beta subunit